ncbi:MAG: acylphosphatase [Ignavibacteriae bacterium]|nr:acylphosphatase [Ignavibacteriota bacterium]
MKSIKIIVSGLVQGVGYRYFCYKKALEYSIYGYARNLYNGNVEVMAQGDEGLINDFIKDLNTGPHYASVKSLNAIEIEVEKKYKEFSIY